jgi:hypothetical protein
VDTTIKVDSQVRDRLAVLAAERGQTIRSLVEAMAADLLTRAERRRRQDDAAAYVAEHLVPGFGAQDVAAGELFWQQLAAGEPGAGDADPSGGNAA